jgi:integrase
MARAKRDTTLESRTNRLKLPVGTRHWVSTGDDCSLGYRRTSEGFGMWQGRIRIEGQYKFTTFGEADDFRDADGIKTLNYFQAYDKARKWSSGLRQDHSNPSVYAQKTLTLRKAAESYLAWFKDHRKAYKETYLNIHAHILPIFGDTLVSELKTAAIKAWLNKLAATPARKRTGMGKKMAFRDAPKTDNDKRARKSSANRSLTILKAILNKAFQDELVTDDTAWRRVKPFENADEPITRFLTEAECTRLINASREDFRALVKAGLFTGARYTELTTLKAKDVNLDSLSVYIQPSKSGKGRHIPLSPQGVDFFKSLRAGKTGQQNVFTKENGEIWGRNHHVRLLIDACHKAKIEPVIGFHELRHTYASLLAQAGADLLTISKLLGHSDTRITSRHYAHLCDKTIANAVNKFLPSFGHVSESKVKSIR